MPELSALVGAPSHCDPNLNSGKALFVLHYTEPSHLGFLTCRTEVTSAVLQAPLQLRSGGPVLASGPGSLRWVLVGGPCCVFSKAPL